jgi:hypothetical protein
MIDAETEALSSSPFGGLQRFITSASATSGVARQTAANVGMPRLLCERLQNEIQGGVIVSRPTRKSST